MTFSIISYGNGYYLRAVSFSPCMVCIQLKTGETGSDISPPLFSDRFVGRHKKSSTPNIFAPSAGPAVDEKVTQRKTLTSLFVRILVDEF